MFLQARACAVETVQAYLNRRGHIKVRFVAFMALIIRFEAILSHFFASCETFIALVTQ